jgi:hypothetical protein
LPPAIDNEDPALQVALIDKELPNFAWLRREKHEERRTCERIESEEPSLVSCSKELEEPRRAIFLTDIEEPRIV